MAASVVPTAWAPLMIMLLTLGGGTPVGSPLPPDPLMAQVAPEECLLYLNWSGVGKIDAHSQNQVEQLMAEPQVQQFAAGIKRFINQLIDKNLDKRAPEGKSVPTPVQIFQDAKDVLALLITHPATLFLGSVTIGPNGPEVQAGAVVGLGDQAAKVQSLLEKYEKMPSLPKIEKMEQDGVAWRRVTISPAPPITWGIKSKYLVVAVGEGQAEAIAKRVGGKPPQWLTAIDQQLPVERRASLTYLNLKSVIEKFVPLGGPQAVQAVEAFGLKNLSALIGVSGLDQECGVNRTLLAIDGEPAGLLGVLGSSPLTPTDLAPIPHDATWAIALRLDANRAVENIVTVASKLDPTVKDQVENSLETVRNQLGVDVRANLLQALGDVWCLYNSPSEGGFVVTGATAVVSVKDHAKLAGVQDILLGLAAQIIAGEKARNPARAPHVAKTSFAGHDIYTVYTGQQGFVLSPAWCLTDKELIVSLFPQNIKAYLNRGADYKSLATLPAISRQFDAAGGPTVLAYKDLPELFKLVYPFLQMCTSAMATEFQRQGVELDVALLPSADVIAKHLRPSITDLRRTKQGIECTQRQTVPNIAGGTAAAGVATSLLLPAVQSARAAARRTVSMNNLRQIGLAMLNYETVNHALPAAYMLDKAGKPGLSWRVTILPYLDEMALYQQFHLDEPWDSEHNKKLIAKMPGFYRSPSGNTGPGKTNYLTVRGDDTMFPGAKGIRLADVKDGLQFTIMAVEANDKSAVIWTKPDDFVPDPKQPLRGLTGLQPAGVIVLFGDGSVQTLTSGLAPANLKAMFTRAGGEVVKRYEQ